METTYDKTNNLFDGWTTSLNRRQEGEIRGFLMDNYPSKNLIQLNDGRFYLD